MRASAFASLALVLLAARPALAMTVAVSFSGSVSGIVALDFATGAAPPLAAEIGQSVGVGTPFSGSLAFDDADPDVTFDSYGATYRVGDPFAAFRTSLGDYAIESDPARGYDLGLHDGDYYGYGISLGGIAHALSGAGASSLSYLTLDFVLQSNSADLLTSTALDEVPWELEAYSQGGHVTWTFQRGSEFVAVTGALDAVSRAAVPEPAIDGLAALGVLGVGALGFRRARS
jgi:hypothetical protein